ncbi:MAG: hypothetical protein KKE44_13430 [Proteobacteria bacterium]|nr:hypothetical protein [Pseudomonadota bacterium]MBU1583728.1 hypothetical protein [Pseudomonadota bacterium]MBU2452543.1 hypothetical protein [Pseudomonadota bacterium]MBU2628743.1 hypothetical protein [Pseudomonadota bacterium]
MKKKPPVYLILLVLFVAVMALTGAGRAAAAKQEMKTIAILPFQINAAQNLDYIRNGMLRMLDSRLSWPQNVRVVPKKSVQKHLADMEGTLGNKQISTIARQTGSDFVLAGSITGLGGSFSIDVQVYDIENKRQMTFFEQSKTIDELISKTDRIAASINKMVFERETVSWEKMEQEKQAYINELKRRNPEYMMKNPQWQNTEQSPGWKIWKYLF